MIVADVPATPAAVRAVVQALEALGLGLPRARVSLRSRDYFYAFDKTSVGDLYFVRSVPLRKIGTATFWIVTPDPDDRTHTIRVRPTTTTLDVVVEADRP